MASPVLVELCRARASNFDWRSFIVNRSFQGGFDALYDR